MISSARSRVVAPSASAVSASASRCSAPVEHRADGEAEHRGERRASASRESACATPPTRRRFPRRRAGRARAPRATSAASSAIAAADGDARQERDGGRDGPRSSAAGIGHAGVGEASPSRSRIASDARSSGSASAAPEPSPSRSSRSSSGSRPSASSTSACPGSGERCDAISASTAAGAMRAGDERRGARDEPVEHARRRARRRSRARRRRGPRSRSRRAPQPRADPPVDAFTASARRTVVDLARDAGVVEPGAAAADERRVDAEERRGERARRRRVADPHLAERDDVDVAELVGERGAGLERRAATSSAVIAGPRAMFAVPGPSRSERTSSGRPRVATPASTTTSRAPAWRASTLIAAPPAAKLSDHLRRHLLRVRATRPRAATP